MSVRTPIGLALLSGGGPAPVLTDATVRGAKEGPYVDVGNKQLRLIINGVNHDVTFDAAPADQDADTVVAKINSVVPANRGVAVNRDGVVEVKVVRQGGEDFTTLVVEDSAANSPAAEILGFWAPNNESVSGDVALPPYFRRAAKNTQYAAFLAKDDLTATAINRALWALGEEIEHVREILEVWRTDIDQVALTQGQTNHDISAVAAWILTGLADKNTQASINKSFMVVTDEGHEAVDANGDRVEITQVTTGATPGGGAPADTAAIGDQGNVLSTELEILSAGAVTVTAVRPGNQIVIAGGVTTNVRPGDQVTIASSDATPVTNDGSYLVVSVDDTDRLTLQRLDMGADKPNFVMADEPAAGVATVQVKRPANFWHASDSLNVRTNVAVPANCNLVFGVGIPNRTTKHDTLVKDPVGLRWAKNVDADILHALFKMKGPSATAADIDGGVLGDDFTDISLEQLDRRSGLSGSYWGQRDEHDNNERPAGFHLRMRDYGLVLSGPLFDSEDLGAAEQNGADGAMSNTLAHQEFTSATATFDRADVGKVLVLDDGNKIIKAHIVEWAGDATKVFLSHDAVPFNGAAGLTWELRSGRNAPYARSALFLDDVGVVGTMVRYGDQAKYWPHINLREITAAIGGQDITNFHITFDAVNTDEVRVEDGGAGIDFTDGSVVYVDDHDVGDLVLLTGTDPDNNHDGWYWVYQPGATIKDLKLVTLTGTVPAFAPAGVQLKARLRYFRVTQASFAKWIFPTANSDGQANRGSLLLQVPDWAGDAEGRSLALVNLSSVSDATLELRDRSMTHGSDEILRYTSVAYALDGGKNVHRILRLANDGRHVDQEPTQGSRTGIQMGGDHGGVILSVWDDTTPMNDKFQEATEHFVDIWVHNGGVGDYLRAVRTDEDGNLWYRGYVLRSTKHFYDLHAPAIPLDIESAWRLHSTAAYLVPDIFETHTYRFEIDLPDGHVVDGIQTRHRTHLQDPANAPDSFLAELFRVDETGTAELLIASASMAGDTGAADADTAYQATAGGDAKYKVNRSTHSYYIRLGYTPDANVDVADDLRLHWVKIGLRGD